MSENKNHIAHLSLSKMKDYLSGKLTEKESHQIEIHMQECNLCADALMGMERMDPGIIGEDVSHLQSLVIEKTRARSRTSWKVRIAAAVVILAISSYLVVSYLQLGGKNQIVASEDSGTESDAQAREGDALAMKDSIQEMNKPAAAEDIEIAGRQLPDERDQTFIENEIDTGAGTDEVTIDMKVVQAETEVDMPEKGLAEEVIITEAEPELLADQKLEGVKEELVKEEAIFRRNSKSAAQSIADQPVEAAPELNTLSGFAAKEVLLIIRVIQGNENADKNAEPESGTIEYVNQILNDLQYPEKASIAEVRGRVTLIFQVGEDGSLSEFKITQSLGYGCDEEAIRVIKKGSRWNAAILAGKPVSQQIEVMVPFPKSGK
ncbi:MAG TPA: TonB family protein [Cyclobacteriaceae bacterium]